jgi:hypothetical protein
MRKWRSGVPEAITGIRSCGSSLSLFGLPSLTGPGSSAAQFERPDHGYSTLVPERAQTASQGPFGRQAGNLSCLRGQVRDPGRAAFDVICGAARAPRRLAVGHHFGRAASGGSRRAAHRRFADPRRSGAHLIGASSFHIACWRLLFTPTTQYSSHASEDRRRASCHCVDLSRVADLGIALGA